MRRFNCVAVLHCVIVQRVAVRCPRGGQGHHVVVGPVFLGSFWLSLRLVLGGAHPCLRARLFRFLFRLFCLRRTCVELMLTPQRGQRHSRFYWCFLCVGVVEVVLAREQRPHIVS